MKRSTYLIFTVCAMALNTSAFAETNPHDPYEKYNRFMFKINDKADQYVLTPVARTYKKITPKPVQTATSNFVNNLRDVVSFGSNLLRGNLAKAGNDFMRVSLNTTFGLGGLINWADEAKMPNNKNHLGDTFASWGWKNSHYFVYPILGPSTVRDSLGSTITTVYSPNQLIIHDTAARYSVTALSGIDARAKLLDTSDSINEAALDKYAYTRDIYMAYRNKQVGNPVTEADENIDDLFDESDSGNPAPQSQSEKQARQNTVAQIQQREDENAFLAKEIPLIPTNLKAQNNIEIPLMPISFQAQKETDDYVNLWQNQAQQNTQFY